MRAAARGPQAAGALGFQRAANASKPTRPTAVRPSGPASSPLLWGLFVLLASIWGSSYLFIKIGVDAGLPPFSLVTARLCFGLAFLIVLWRWVGARLPRDLRTLAKIGLLGAMNVAIPFSLITWGELSIPSAVASILNGVQPLFTIVIAALALRDEPITAGRLAGLIVGFVGVVLILSPELSQGSTAAHDGGAPSVLVGELAVLVAALGYGASGVYIRRALSAADLVDDPVHGPRPLGPIEIALPQVFSAACIAGVLALLFEWGPAGHVVLPPTAAAWFAVTWLGVLGSALAYLLYFRLISSWGATRASLVTYAMPVVGIMLGLVVLSETIDLRTIAGAVLVIGGIGLVNSRSGQRRLLGRAPAPIADDP